MGSRKKVAAIVTTYFSESHANLIVTKFLAGFPTEEGVIEPRVDIVVHVHRPASRRRRRDGHSEGARGRGIPQHPGCPDAGRAAARDPGRLTDDWEDGELAVDGVLLIAEHGDYPYNERDRRLYPRRHMFEQICGVFSGSGRSVPVFSDKHLSYNWTDAIWMYDRAKELGVPFMAGSSLPVVRREPELEHEIGTPIEEALEIGFINSYKTGLDSYGFHGLETLQCMVERRAGGRDGYRGGAVPGGAGRLGGRDVGATGLWSSPTRRRRWPSRRRRAAERTTARTRPCSCWSMRTASGPRSLILPGHLRGWGYAARVNGAVEATGFNPGTGWITPSAISA